MLCLVAQSCPAYCDPMDSRAMGSRRALWTLLSMGILQARTLQLVAMPSSKDLPNSGIKPRSPAIAGKFLTVGATREAEISSRQF